MDLFGKCSAAGEFLQAFRVPSRSTEPALDELHRYGYVAPEIVLKNEFSAPDADARPASNAKRPRARSDSNSHTPAAVEKPGVTYLVERFDIEPFSDFSVK